MLALIGIAVVTISVFLGFAIAGGPMLVLLQPAEFLIIGGSAAGSLLIATTPTLMRQIMRQALGAMQASPFNRRCTSICCSFCMSCSARRRRAA